MALIVQKFGGTSLADPAAREQLVAKVAKAKAAGDKLVLVVSAMGRRGDPYATDTLLDLLGEFPGGADPLTADLMASCGEVISACMISALLNSRGIPALPMTAYSAGIYAEGPFQDAAPAKVEKKKLQAALDLGLIPVVTGFQGADKNGNMLTLGRGGSDTSAVAIGAALDADFVDIYKDVPGVAKADPRVVKDAPFMEYLDYDSMWRLANHGARVLHDKSAMLAEKKNLRIRVRSTFDEGEGTLIGGGKKGFEVPAFIGLSTSPAPGDKVRVTAVFAKGKGEGRVGAAAKAAEASGIKVDSLRLEDPDAIAFLCDKVRSMEFANIMFKSLN